jgi:hypothetical protein
MRITLLQLLVFIALVWGFFTFAPQRLRPSLHLPTLGLSSSRGLDAQTYFARVLQGIENTRKTAPGRELPVAQSCATLTPYKPDATVASCYYQPSVGQGFYIVTVTSKTGATFRYSGYGR